MSRQLSSLLCIVFFVNDKLMTMIRPSIRTHSLFWKWWLLPIADRRHIAALHSQAWTNLQSCNHLQHESHQTRNQCSCRHCHCYVSVQTQHLLSENSYSLISQAYFNRCLWNNCSPQKTLHKKDFLMLVRHDYNCKAETDNLIHPVDYFFSQHQACLPVTSLWYACHGQ